MSLNEYRVQGDFEYLNDEGNERIKSVNCLQDASSEKEAAKLVLEDYANSGYANGYDEPGWCFGYPTVTYVRSVAERELNVSTFWTRKPREQEVIRRMARGQ